MSSSRIAAVVAFAITLGLQACGGGSNSGSSTKQTGPNPLSQALIDEFVTAHNAARGGPLDPPPSPPLPPVSWDSTLADSAYGYLGGCPGGSIDLAPHNAERASDYKALGGTGSVGENIFAGTASVSPTDAVNTWMREGSKYDYSTNNIADAGHYTQVVWRDSVRIGCAIVDCPNYTYSNTVLCDYAPAGNNVNQKPY
jgi:hypothetical protein